ncbi:hypothetical protein MO973_29320 [Paenibacillus sp. TRM 82003]|uniref:hypothetical protein n=1 Tax=Kineococcus sp. TRM81007 TaxID=2925831 RepID=UPI001F57A84D|nr:hypothetical protein [Kineococcus sp. TRM81007]MCI2238924.1 hypothetical protein [Kineococcus sp. TRM81007]MCI3924331.1 hypothetical protein [Paenibacillus sp. TRM 82003]
MAGGLLGKVTRFLSTPQGRRFAQEATRRVQTAAKDPATRRKIDTAVAQLRRRGGGGTGGTHR